MPNLRRQHPIILLAICLCGCTSKDASDAASAKPVEAQVPTKSFREAVADAIALRDTIRDGFAAGDVDAAHGPLHDIGHCLLAIPKAAESELTGEESQKVSDAIDELMDAFGEVDKTLHGADGSTYEEEALTINNGFLTLAELAGISLQPAPENVLPADSGTGSDNGTQIQEAPAIQDVPPIQNAAEIQDASPPPRP